MPVARPGGDTAGADTSPTRHAELHDEHTRTQAQLDDLATAATPDQEPGLLDELPYLASQLERPPPNLALLAMIMTLGGAGAGLESESEDD
jgi:hypothetical protein